MSIPDNVVQLPTAAPIRAARGRAARSELVLVYKILHKAGRPLTVPEIAELCPRTGYLSEAMNRYREHKERTDPTWLSGRGDRWPADCEREAMVWWVRGIVKYGLTHRILECKTKPVGRNVKTEGSYVPGRPPMVSVKVYREHKTLVPWTPELETGLSRGHVAGMEFLRLLRDYRDGHKRIPADLDKMLGEAERAIDVKYQQGRTEAEGEP
jgi:hypothetical protein